jgi:acyl phosphate:glycerol-3-phosphate acyltransferase
MNTVFIYCVVGLAMLGAYLVGSIPTGYWIARYIFHVDVTKQGSGNIGATNVARVLQSKKLFFLVFFLDAAKAYGWLLVCDLLCTCMGLRDTAVQFLLFASVLLLVGNAHSIFLKFSGGKGVSTLLGILSMASPFLALIFIGVWVIVLALWRRVDVASLAATAILPIAYVFVAPVIQFTFIIFMLFVVAWIFFRHRDNLARMV